MKTLVFLFIGALIGLAIPLACDLVMFNTLAPCRTVSNNNNVIVQECRVK